MHVLHFDIGSAMWHHYGALCTYRGGGPGHAGAVITGAGTNESLSALCLTEVQEAVEGTTRLE